MNKIVSNSLNIIKSIFDFKHGHSRSIKAKKNIYASLLIRGIGLSISFILVRIILEYIDKERYGIWLTLASFLEWALFFELGLGNGLRNKLATAIAKGDFILGKIYVSTTYFILALIVILISGLFFILNPFLDWTSILNTSSELKKELYLVSTIVFGCFFVQFVLKLISNILYADQLPALSTAIMPVSSILILIQVILLNKFTEGNLIYLSVVLSVNPLIVYLGFTFWLFKSRYKRISPHPKFIKWRYGKNLISLGFSFFTIAISNLVILQLSNLIIAHLFSPSDVAVYNIAYKLFSLSTLIFIIITSPLWSAYTEAWVKNEKEWITDTINKMRRLWILLLVFNLALLLLSPYIFHFWVGSHIEVPFKLSIGLVIFFSIMDYGRIFLQFTNGISKLRVQLIATFIGAVIYLPLCFLFINYFEFGLISIPIAMIISQFKTYFVAPLQYKRLITETAKGIWNK